MTESAGGGAAEPSKDETAVAIVKKLQPVIKPDKRREAVQIVTSVVEKMHIGPLPPPEDLAAYEQLHSGSAERIIAMAEREQSHRHSMEQDWLKKQFRLQSGGQRLAFLALVVMLLVVAFTFYIGQPIAASILGGTTIVAVVGMFLGYHKKSGGEENLPPKQQQAKRKAGGKKR